MKRKSLVMIATLSLTGVLLTGCGLKESDQNGEYLGLKQSEAEAEAGTDATNTSDEEEVTGVPRGEKIEQSEEDTDDETEISDEEEEQSEEDTFDAQEVKKEYGAVEEVEIDGQKYLQIDYTEDENSVAYIFEGYALTVVSTWEEVGEELYVDEDAGTFSFDVVLSDGEVIRGMLVEGDFNKKPYQLGYDEPGDFSDMFKKYQGEEFKSTVSFGKAFYDYNGKLTIDVMITKTGKFYTDSLVIELE